MSGRSPITTPAAWIESARTRPSSGSRELDDLARGLVLVDGLRQVLAPA